MGRWKFRDSAQTYVGSSTQIVRIPGATITVYLAGTTTAYAGTIWRNATGLTGGDQYANPFTTDATGLIEFFLDVGIPVKVQITKPSDPTVGTLTVDYEPVVPDPRDIVTATKSGVLYLMDYAGGLAIGNGSLDATFAFTAMFAAATAGQTCLVPTGTYVITQITPSHGVTLLAQGGSAFTTLKRKAAYTAGALWNAGATTDTCLEGFTVDGNKVAGSTVAEIDLGGGTGSPGARNVIRNVTVIDWNHTAIWPHGQDNVLEDVTMIGQARNPGHVTAGAYVQDSAPNYQPTIGTGASTDYGSIYGTNVAGNHFCDGLIVRGLRARRIRSAGVVLGGTNLNADAIFCDDTHRQFFDYQTSGTPLLQGGGQFALSITRTAAGVNDAQAPTRMTFNGIHIGPAQNLGESGIDVSGGVDLDFVGVHIENQASGDGPSHAWGGLGTGGAGMSFLNCTRVRVRGGESIRTTLGGYAGIAITDCNQMEIDGHDFKNLALGIYFAPGTNANNSIRGIGFDGCTANLQNSSSDANFTSIAHRVKSGPAVANSLPKGLTVGGDLTVPAGTVNIASFSASASAIAATAATAGGIGATITAASGAVAFLNTTAAAGLNAILGLQRSGVLKASLGLDASDIPTMFGSGGAAMVTLNDTYTTMATSPTLSQVSGVTPLTINYARYRLFGKWAHVLVSVTVGSSPTGTGAASIKLVLPSSNPNLSSLRTGSTSVVGMAYYLDSGTITRGGLATAATATNIVIQCDNKGDVLGTASDAMVVAVNDTIVINLMYELA